MYFTGIADEAAKSLEGQIKATKELGWSNIESRCIDGTNIHNISDSAFDAVVAQLEGTGVSINCFGSEIANWKRHIDKPADEDIAAVKRAIARMNRLGTKLIRIMSYAVLPGRSPEDQMKEERFERIRTITNMFLDAGIQPVHENCMNYGGMGWSYTLALLDNVPGLKLVYDTGNPVTTDDRTKPEPYPKQSSWTFYQAVKDHVAYFHIKDGIWDGEKMNYTYPGLGDGDVRKILEDALKGGYDGGISIEPHLVAIFHEKATVADHDRMYTTYVEYGRRIEAMVKEIKAGI